MRAYQQFQEALELTPGVRDAYQYPAPFNRIIAPINLLLSLFDQAIGEEFHDALRLVEEELGEEAAEKVRRRNRIGH